MELARLTPEARARVDAAYAEHRRLVRRIADVLAVRYRQRFEDMVMDAQHAFLEAAAAHDPARGPLETRIVTVVYGRLMDGIRKRARAANGSRPVEYTGISGDMEAPKIPEAFDERDLHLGRDARLLTSLVLSAPKALFGDNIWDGFDRAAVRKTLAAELRRRGLSGARVKRAFREVSTRLAGGTA